MAPFSIRLPWPYATGFCVNRWVWLLPKNNSKLKKRKPILCASTGNR